MAALVFLLTSSFASATFAQQNAQQPGSAKTPAAATPQQTPAAAHSGNEKGAAQPVQLISSGQALYLVRSILLTLNDANRSGNYTVLRDLAAPDFQAKNTAADLAQNFADLRHRNFDLFAAALLDPKFTAAPTLDANGRARMTGFFPTHPLQISFDLTFQSVGGQWRLLVVSIATPSAPTEQSQINPVSPRRSPGLFYGFRVLSGSAGLRW